jgi:hypothetical protein
MDQKQICAAINRVTIKIKFRVFCNLFTYIWVLMFNKLRLFHLIFYKCLIKSGLIFYKVPKIFYNGKLLVV